VTHEQTDKNSRAMEATPARGAPGLQMWASCLSSPLCRGLRHFLTAPIRLEIISRSCWGGRALGSGSEATCWPPALGDLKYHRNVSNREGTSISCQPRGVWLGEGCLHASQNSCPPSLTPSGLPIHERPLCWDCYTPPCRLRHNRQNVRKAGPGKP
jgi:hypothetical protein